MATEIPEEEARAEDSAATVDASKLWIQTRGERGNPLGMDVRNQAIREKINPDRQESQSAEGDKGPLDAEAGRKALEDYLNLRRQHKLWEQTNGEQGQQLGPEIEKVLWTKAMRTLVEFGRPESQSTEQMEKQLGAEAGNHVSQHPLDLGIIPLHEDVRNQAVEEAVHLSRQWIQTHGQEGQQLGAEIRKEALEDIVYLNRLWREKKIGERLDLTGKILRGANLRGVDLREGAELDDAHLVNAHLDGATLNGAHLNEANLDGANLNAADLFKATLVRAHFLNGADLTGTELMKAELQGATFEEADFKGAPPPDAPASPKHVFPNPPDPDPRKIPYYGLSPELTELPADGKRPLLDKRIRDAALAEILELHRQWLTSDGKEGERLDFSGKDLRGAKFTGANLNEADLTEADLSGASMLRAQLSGAQLPGAHLASAQLPGASFNNATLIGAFLCETNLRFAEFDEATLRSADLRGAKDGDFRGAINLEAAASPHMEADPARPADREQLTELQATFGSDGKEPIRARLPQSHRRLNNPDTVQPGAKPSEEALEALADKINRDRLGGKQRGNKAQR